MKIIHKILGAPRYVPLLYGKGYTAYDNVKNKFLLDMPKEH